MVEKRYRWLQLDEDFFRRKTMRKLRRIAGGDTYIIIYLKMQLLSLQYAGKIFFEGVEEDLAAEIALIIDEDADNVRITLSFLQKYELIVQSSDDEDTYILPETMEAIGSVTAGAIRQRKHRAKEKALHCHADITLLSQNGDDNNNTTTTENNNNREQQQYITGVDSNMTQADILLLLSKIGCKDQQAVNVVKDYGIDAVQTQLVALSHQDNIRNPIGWLLAALRDNYVNQEIKYVEQKAVKAAENKQLMQALLEQEEKAAMAKMDASSSGFWLEYERYAEKQKAKEEAIV